MTMDTVETLLEKELKDIYDAEKRLTKNLPKMAKAAHSPELREAIQEHLEVTKNQVARLEQAFRAMDVKAQAKTCAGMKGILEEGEETLGMKAEDKVADLALIGAARKVEHYEIAAYTSLIGMAESMEMSEVEQLLRENLEEEEEADSKLSELAEQMLEAEDSSAEDEDEEEEEGAMATTTTGRARKR